MTPFGYELIQIIFYLNLNYLSLGIALLDARHRRFPANMVKYFGTDVKKLPAVDEIDIKAGIEEELLLCQRSAYIGYSDEVRAYRGHLHQSYPRAKEFRVTRNPLYLDFLGWTFGTNNEHKVVRHFVAVIEMGIYDKVVEYANKNKFKRDHNFIGNITENVFSSKVLNEESTTTLSGSILTVFICWGCGKFIAGCIFFAEILSARFASFLGRRAMEKDLVRNWYIDGKNKLII